MPPCCLRLAIPHNSLRFLLTHHLLHIRATLRRHTLNNAPAIKYIGSGLCCHMLPVSIYFPLFILCIYMDRAYMPLQHAAHGFYSFSHILLWDKCMRSYIYITILSMVCCHKRRIWILCIIYMVYGSLARHHLCTAIWVLCCFSARICCYIYSSLTPYLLCSAATAICLYSCLATHNHYILYKPHHSHCLTLITLRPLGSFPYILTPA